jgi:cytochrome b
MVIALLLCLAATVVTGLIVYAEKERAGPLAPFYAGAPAIPGDTGGSVASEREDGERAERGRGGRPESPFEEMHEVIANITLFLVILHVLGVVLASFVHHENLVRAMITGRKRAEGTSATASP